MTTGLLGTAAALMLANALPAEAQQTEIAALRTQIEELTNRLNQLESDQKKAAANGPTVQSASKSDVSVSGLLQVQANGYFSQSGPDAPTANTIRLRRGEIKLSGKMNSRISGWVMIDPAKQLSANAVTVPGGGGTVTPTLNQATNILQELVVSDRLSKTANGEHFIDIGQFKIPVGYEGDLVSSKDLSTVERSLIYRVRDPFRGGYGDIRDSGAQLKGTFGQIDYRLGVFNGLGERQNTTALTSNKAYIGRLVFKPAGLPGSQFGISGATGNTGSAAGTPRDDRSLFNLFGVWKRDKWNVQGEYLKAKAQTIGGLPAATVRDLKGYYGHVGYRVAPQVELIGRYDIVKFDRGPATGDTKEITLGVNYYLIKDKDNKKDSNAKIQANIVRVEGDPTGLSGFRNDRTELRTQYQVAF